MIGPVFVDTNVLVYARDASEPGKQARAMLWLEHLWRERTGRLSVQVLQEFYHTVTGRLGMVLSWSAESRPQAKSKAAPARITIK